MPSSGIVPPGGSSTTFRSDTVTFTAGTEGDDAGAVEFRRA